MNGSRMSLSQAEGLLGQPFAGCVNAGASDGSWLVGKVVAYTEHPTITIEQDDGTRHSYVISCIRDWSSPAPEPDTGA